MMIRNNMHILITGSSLTHLGRRVWAHIHIFKRHPPTHTQIASYSCPKQTSVKPLGRFSHTSNTKDSLQPYSVTLSVSPKLHESCCFGYRGSLCFTWKHKPPRRDYKWFDIRPSKRGGGTGLNLVSCALAVQLKWMCVTLRFSTGVGNGRPPGRMVPTRLFDTAREAIHNKKKWK